MSWTTFYTCCICGRTEMTGPGYPYENDFERRMTFAQQGLRKLDQFWNKGALLDSD